MRKIAILGTALVLTACANIKVTSPVQKEIARSKVYDLEYEQTWIRAVDWFADHNVQIEKIEKTSGLITAKYSIRDNDGFLDCGDIKVSGTLNGANVHKYGSLNVTVRNRGERSTRVNVNFFGEFELSANDAWDGRLVKTHGECVSNGRLEKSVLDYIGD